MRPVKHAAWVGLDRGAAFATFTNEIGAWWPLRTHGLYQSSSGGVSFRDGRLVEHSLDGRENTWGEILDWQAPSRLAITWYPGRDRQDATRVSVSFEADDGGTWVTVEHDGWEALGEQSAARRRAYCGPGTWGSVLDHFVDATESHPNAPDLAAVVQSYDAFFAEAERGGFGDPAGDGWDADQVLAHVALNDGAMIAICQALIHDEPARFENELCQDPAVQAAWIQSCGDRDALIARGRTSASCVVAALGRLSADQLATEVHCYLSDGGEVVLDAPLPWINIAVGAQAGRHLRGHTQQLIDLRDGAGSV